MDWNEIAGLINGEHCAALMLVLVLCCILSGRKALSERVHQGSFWITIIACTLLAAQNILENYAQLDPARRQMRLITSIAGYSLRPMAVLGFLLVVWPAHMRRWFLWIPIILNALVYCTALFSPLAFSFDENYSFSRGPLGTVMFFVCIAFLALTLAMVHVRFRDRRPGQLAVLYLCALCCFGAMAMDLATDGICIVLAILISCMTFYLFLRAQDTDHDPLTRLWNRLVFYADCREYRNAITAGASVDMNGLKQTNDELGHDAGDRALRMIGRGIRSVMSRKVLGYRIGGDEFMLLFLHCGEEEIERTMSAFLDEIRRAGLSVAVGTAARQEADENLDEMIRLSDRRMYTDKREYYMKHDRRGK